MKFAMEMQEEPHISIKVVDSAEQAFQKRHYCSYPAKRPYVKASWVAGGSLYLHM